MRQLISTSLLLCVLAGARPSQSEELLAEAVGDGGEGATSSGGGSQAVTAVTVAGAVAWLAVVGLVMVQFRRQRRLAQRLDELSALAAADGQGVTGGSLPLERDGPGT